MDSELSRLCAAITSKCNRLRSSTEQIRSLTGQLGTAHDSEDFREKLHARQHEALQLAAELVRSVSDLDARAQFADRGMKAQVDRVREMCIQTTTAFQAAQRDMVGKERESLAQARSKSHRPLIDVGFATGDLGLDRGSATGVRQPDYSDQQEQVEADVDVVEIEERERAIQGIEQDIVRVNEMFRDFARLVHEQNDPIDSIAFNVETAHVDVASATQNLEKAVRQKRSLRKKKCICAIIFLVVIGIVVLILIFAFHGSQK